MTSPRTLVIALLAVGAACGTDSRAHEPPRAAASRARDTSRSVPAVQAQPGDSVGRAAPIGPADFTVAGVSDVMDSAAVRRAKGAPDSVWVEQTDEGSQLTRWRYTGMLVTFGSDSTVSSVEILGREVITPRGLRVGDPVSRVRALYGVPRDSIGGAWEYDDDSLGRWSSTHVMRIAIRAERVASMYVGWIAD